jgi:hypothetical protein
MNLSLREQRGVALRPQRAKVGEETAWWIFDDLGPYDGPHDTLNAAWERIDELYASAQENRI